MFDEEAHTAMHEAAHCVAAEHLGYRVDYVSIEPEAHAGGTRHGGTAISRSQARHYSLQDELTLAWAGFAAAGLWGCEGDAMTAAYHYAERGVHLAHLGSVEKSRRYDLAVQAARKILREHSAALDELGIRLLRNKRLEGREVRQIIEDVRLGRIAA